MRWEDAITMIYLDKADVVVEYEDTVRSPSMTLKVPAVVRVRRAIKNVKQGVKFSRINVYTRDRFTCQYCVRKFKMGELSYDHVTPRFAGGRTEWTNIVTACKPCNNKKAHRTCDEAGMWPRTPPVKPKTLPLTPPAIDVHNAPIEWRDFLSAFST
jgi:5-methylcytosine-specific restriction endonuclease McrA